MRGGALARAGAERYFSAMCNLYSLTRSQDEIRQLARSMRDTTGNLPSLPGIFPDTMAPVVRTTEDGCANSR